MYLNKKLPHNQAEEKNKSFKWLKSTSKNSPGTGNLWFSD